MELTVLGSSGGCAAPGNPASGYLITHGDTTIWCDAGSGTFMALMELMDPADVDAIVFNPNDPDALNPRQALDLLYRLKALLDPAP